MRYLLGLFLLPGIVILEAAPRFQDPVNIKANGKDIVVQYYGAPYVYDWDSDGKKDLLIGQLYFGNIRFYRNIGTNNNPVFGDSAFLYADGSEIRLPYG